MTTSDTIDKLATALAQAQGEMDGAKKSATNPFFEKKYADLASVKEAMRAPFAKAGLSVVQFPKTTFNGEPTAFEWTAKRSGEVRYGVRVFTIVTVVTRLLHSSGQWMEDQVSAMLPNGDPQAVGSAITYLRRYALQAVAGIATEDDDAEATTRGRLLPAKVRPVVDVALVPIAHPDGYLEWLDALRAAAQHGLAPLEAAYTKAPKAFRVHLPSHDPDLLDTLKAIAERSTVTPMARSVS
jgi:hypothetical protein